MDNTIKRYTISSVDIVFVITNWGIYWLKIDY